MAKATLIVLDSLGIGGAPDASLYNDEGSNTFGSIAVSCLNGNADIGREGALRVPNLESLGIYSAVKLSTGLTFPDTNCAIGSYAVAQERSKGKILQPVIMKLLVLQIQLVGIPFPRLYQSSLKNKQTSSCRKQT